MGSVEDWHALNAHKTRKAAEELVWQNRAAHLREQGTLPSWAGPAEARAYDEARKRRAQAASNAEFQAPTLSREQRDAEADPRVSLRFGGMLFGPAMVLHVLAWLAGSSLWMVVTGLGIAVTIVWTFVVVLADVNAARRHRRRTNAPRPPSPNGNPGVIAAANIIGAGGVLVGLIYVAYLIFA